MLVDIQVSKEIEIKTFSNTCLTLVKTRNADNNTNRMTLLRNTSPDQSSGKMVSLDLNSWEINEVQSIVGLGRSSSFRHIEIRID